MTHVVCRPYIRISVIVLVVLIALYGIAGFFIVPPLGRPRIVSAVEEVTGRPVHRGDLDVNPFALSATLEDFRLRWRRSSRTWHVSAAR
jgi:hypothetical protein